MNVFRVCYIGENAAEIRNGEIYEAKELLDSKNMIGVFDRSGEWYVYHKKLFEAWQQSEKGVQCEQEIDGA